MTAPESNTFLKRVRAIRDFVARHIDSGVARESKKASCAALRSNASKNASKNVSKSSFVKSSKNSSRKACGSCTSRALLSLFVASATLLATFVIAPTSALSAGENTGEKVSTGETVGAKSDSAKSEGENKQQPKQSESNNTELDKKDTGSSSTLTNNKESNPVEKQQNAGNKVDDKAKSTDSDVKKNAKDAQKKAASADAVNGTDRSVKDAGLSEECGSKPFKRCYVVSYYNDKIVVDNNHPVLIQPGNTITIKPKFKIKSTNKQADMPSGVWFKLEQYLKYPVPSWANFEKDNGATKVKDTSKDKTGFDGSVKLRPGKWDRGSYKFRVYAYYESEKIYATISVKVDVSDVQNDLKLSLYDFVNKQAGAQIKDNKIIIEPKSNSQGAGVTDKKDTYDSINKLFIDSRSKDKLGFIYHRMICHETGSDDNASYTLDSVNGLSLGTQTQFEHKENQNRTDENSENSAVYENDDYIERSQSWITGTPTKAGTFVCEVFALKPSELKIEEYISGAKFPKVKETSTMIKEFDERVKTNKDMKLLFDDPKQNIVEDKWTNKADIQQGIDWDYKSVTIEVKSSEPPKPTIGDNDLTLKVYPFNGSKTALTSDNNKISAILGMSLKPFVDATSAADSANKITLRVLCSKGEKKDSGSQPTQPSGSSQPAKPSQAEEPLEYKTWSSNLAELGLSVPADDNQNTCHSNKEGEKTCESVDPNKKVAARTDMEVSIKPTDVGNYQCVVFALKPKALTTFDDAINKLAQSGSLTPDSIKSALTTAKPTAFKENKDFAAFKLNIDSVSNFTLPHTGGQSWNLQLGILAALLVNLLAAGFVVSQSERGRKLILGRWRGLCNHV
ncbi:hypothetical protein HXT24_05905 [Gardnerella sp. DNF00354]|uniref:hypothetical protein n=1 Tax=Gardnerella sp. DNF00354 TaxID=2749046 RepID=UPI003BAFF12B